MAIRSINPATAEVEAEFEEWTPDETSAAVGEAADAFAAWRETPVAERAALVRRVGSVLRERSGHFGGLITAEMGKPIAQSREEVEKCADCCEYFASKGPAMVAGEDAAQATRITFEPLGPVLAVMPWNFPFCSCSVSPRPRSSPGTRCS